MVVGVQLKDAKLTNEQLFALYHETNDDKYLTKIVESNIWLVIKLVKAQLLTVSFSHMDDMMQEGCLGYYEGLKRYNPYLEVKVNSHCYFWVKKYINVYLEKYEKLVRLPQHVLRAGAKQSVSEYLPEFHDATDEEYIDAYEWIDYIVPLLTTGKEDAEKIFKRDPSERKIVITTITNNFKAFLLQVREGIKFIDDLFSVGEICLNDTEMKFWQSGMFSTRHFSIRAKDVLLYEQKKHNFSVIKLKGGNYKIKL